jgi:ERCC4-type nuclease
MADAAHRIVVDHSERRSALLEAVRRGGAFKVQMARLATGDDLIENQVLVERKSATDLAASLVDGRLFPQVARLAHSGYRSLLLIEGPRRTTTPRVHDHALEGTLVSIAVMWRLPVLYACDADQSVRLLRFMADQVHGRQEQVLRRFDRKPKRLASRRLFLLQALPGIGPALARRLLGHFGSIERIMVADVAALAEVGGIGAKKAARIRELVREEPVRVEGGRASPSEVARAD